MDEIERHIGRSEAESRDVAGDAPAGGKGHTRRTGRGQRGCGLWGARTRRLPLAGRLCQWRSNALLAKAIPGRPPKVSAEEMQWLAQAVRDHSPLQFKFEFGLWTLPLIAALIERQFGKKLALSGVSRIMKLLGFSAQKPLYQAWQQDATLVRQWEFETYPAIRAEAREVGATIYFADESDIRSDYHTGTTWAPQGCTPVVEATGKRFSLNMISAVGPQGEFRFMVHDGTVTALSSESFSVA